MKYKIQKTLSLGALCTMAFLGANSAFADDLKVSSSSFYIIDGDYSYANWVSDGWSSEAVAFTSVTYYALEGDSYVEVASPVSGTTYYIIDSESDTGYNTAVCETYYIKNGDYSYVAVDYSVAATTSDELYTWTSPVASTSHTANKSFDNVTVAAGATYTFSSPSTTQSRTLAISGSMYLYGNAEATAKFTESIGTTTVTIGEDLILNYGTWAQSASNSMTVTGDIEMYNTSYFTVAAGTVSMDDFYVSGDSVVNINGSTGTNKTTLTVDGTLTLTDNAYFKVLNTNSANSSITLGGIKMSSDSVYEMSKAGTLTISSGATFEMNDNASFQKTAGTLTFATGSTIKINGGSFSSNTTTLNGMGTISLTLSSVDVDNAVATVLGSIELGTITFGSTSDLWTIALDVGGLLDSFDCDFEILLSNLITINNTDTSNLAISLVNSDYYTASLSGTTVSFTYTVTAVPEPSTYAMILGVIALGFAAYRRRK